MATDNILRTYGDQSIKESVLGLVEYLTEKEMWFLNNLPKSKAIAATHSTLVDTYRAAGSQAVEETGDSTALALTTPTRISNVVEHIAIPFKVGKFTQEVERYTGENELVRETTKAVIEWGRAAEYDILRSTLVSGASGVAPKMKGILEGISKSTNVSAHASGTEFSASILRAIMKDNYVNSNGDIATDLFVGPYLRMKIDEFTQKTNVVVYGVEANKIVQGVSVFETSFGPLKIHTHRYLNIDGTDATGRVLGIRPEKFGIAYVREPKINDLAAQGDYDFKEVRGDLTLEIKNQDSNFLHTGFFIG